MFWDCKLGMSLKNKLFIQIGPLSSKLVLRLLEMHLIYLTCYTLFTWFNWSNQHRKQSATSVYWFLHMLLIC